jgi:hypothetical protein
MWKKHKIEELMEFIVEIAISGHEQNRIMYCYNTILVICLSCEFLQRIGNNIRVFKHEANEYVERIL